MRRLRSSLSFANVTSVIALFVALGGGAYAAVNLPKNSVGSKQIKANAIDSSKVKDHSLLAKDLRAGQLLAGARGAQGPKGDPGAPGPPGPSTGPAAGDLTGTYPSPAIAAGAVNTGKLADGAVTQQKLADGVTASPTGAAGGALTGSYPSPRLAPLPAWHIIGGPGEPPLENGWGGFGLSLGWAPPGFYKDRDGIVHLRGMVAGGTSYCIFTLPPGYRPPYSLGFPSVTQGGSTITAVRIYVTYGGSVCLTAGFQSSVDTLEGIQFRTDS